MKLILFPGQGSQFKGMGKALFAAYPHLVASASSLLGYSLEELCLQDPRSQLNQTDYTQPALYVVNALSYYEKANKNGQADFFAGHSLGEYNALLAAEAFDFVTGLKLVQKRGQLMAQAQGGGMLAVLQIPIEQVEELLQKHQLTSLDIANYNTPTQTILSGPKDAIVKAEAILTQQNIRCVPLNVSAAFHSRYMQKAMEEFATFLTQFNFKPLTTPVIANVTARPYTDNNIAQLLAKQIAGSVRWSESIRYMMGQAQLRGQSLEYQEMGDNPVLTKMVIEIQKTQTPLIVAPEPSAPSVVSPKVSSAQASIVDTGDFIISAEHLGNVEFKKEYGIKYAYVAGAMYRGIGSKELVVAMGKAGLMAFLGTGGLKLSQIKEDLAFIQSQLTNGESYGMNLLCNLDRPEMELATVELYLQQGVRRIEAAAFMQMTPALVYYRLKGLEQDANGQVRCKHQIMAKVSRPEVAEMFMSPAPESMVEKMLQEGKINFEQAQLAKRVPMSHDVCVEADSGGHTDQGVSTVLLPSIQNLRTTLIARYGYKQGIRIGLAGGIGTPQAVAAAFTMGADFVLTGSVNQCTVESGASEAMKNLLQDIDVQDTDYAPAGDMFELGARVQVLKKGLFFPARANKLYTLYTQYNSLEEIPEKVRMQIEDKYFKRSFNTVWEETKQYLAADGRQPEIAKAEANPKRKMAWVFRWYFGYSTRLAHAGDETQRVDYQIHTGPAVGAFNQWVKGTPLESWRNRHVDKIAHLLMTEAAQLLSQKFGEWAQKK